MNPQQNSLPSLISVVCSNAELFQGQTGQKLHCPTAHTRTHQTQEVSQLQLHQSKPHPLHAVQQPNLRDDYSDEGNEMAKR